jgi:hypothetical protein
VVGALGLAGCGRLAGGGSASAGASDLSWDGQALEAIGFNPSDLVPAANVTDATPDPTATGKAGNRKARFRKLRFAFGKKLLHGEATVQTDDGTKTVDVQRGSVTAVDATSVTVKSTDGFTLVWHFGSPFTVVQNRAKVDPSAITVGESVGVAGTRDGDTVNARLLVITG